MPYYVYIILCMDGSYYTGYTQNLDARMRLHENGRGARYLKMHKPQRVAHFELFFSRKNAMRREKEIKKLTHQQKLSLISSKIRRDNDSALGKAGTSLL